MKKKAKRILALILSVSCLIALSACSEAVPTETVSPTQPQRDETPAPTSDVPEETPVNTPDPTPSPAEEVLNRPTDIPERTLETRLPVLKEQPEVGENGLVEFGQLIVGETVNAVGVFWDRAHAGEEYHREKPRNIFAGLEKRLRSNEYAGLPLKITFATDAKTKLVKYSFVSDLSDDPEGEGRPTAWKLYAANLSNYEDEILLDERSGIELPLVPMQESEIFEIENPGYYQFYRIEFLSTAGNTAVLRLNEMYLYGIDGDMIQLPDMAKNSDISDYIILNGLIKEKLAMMEPHSQNEFGGEINTAKSFFDCNLDTSAIQCFQYSKDVEYFDVLFVFGTAMPFDAYRFTLAEYNIGSGPCTWEILGTNDKKLETYDVLDRREKVAIPGYSFAETDVYELQKIGNYKYYIIRVYDTTNYNDEKWMSPRWSEFTVLQKK